MKCVLDYFRALPQSFNRNEQSFISRITENVPSKSRLQAIVGQTRFWRTTDYS